MCDDNICDRVCILYLCVEWGRVIEHRCDSDMVMCRLVGGLKKVVKQNIHKERKWVKRSATAVGPLPVKGSA